MAHTPTPWETRTFADDHTFIYSESGLWVANVGMQHHKANAAFIVKAVNAHDDLVAALQSSREYFDNRSDADHNGEGFVPNAEMRLVTEIDDALAKAEGKQ